jgi:hypothetical protein
MFANDNHAINFLNTAINAAIIGFCTFKPAKPVDVTPVDYFHLFSSHSSQAMAA